MHSVQVKDGWNGYADNSCITSILPLLCCISVQSVGSKVCAGACSNPVKLTSRAASSSSPTTPPSLLHVVCHGVATVLYLGVRVVSSIICHGAPTVLSPALLSPLFSLLPVLMFPLAYYLSWCSVCSNICPGVLMVLHLSCWPFVLSAICSGVSSAHSVTCPGIPDLFFVPFVLMFAMFSI